MGVCQKGNEICVMAKPSAAGHHNANQLATQCEIFEPTRSRNARRPRAGCCHHADFVFLASPFAPRLIAMQILRLRRGLLAAPEAPAGPAARPDKSEKAAGFCLNIRLEMARMAEKRPHRPLCTLPRPLHHPFEQSKASLHTPNSETGQPTLHCPATERTMWMLGLGHFSHTRQLPAAWRSAPHSTSISSSSSGGSIDSVVAIRNGRAAHRASPMRVPQQPRALTAIARISFGTARRGALRALRALRA